MAWKTSDFALPVEQATAAPGEARELIHTFEGDYVEVWEIEPPPPGVGYFVVDQVWETDTKPPVRRIRKIKLAQ